MAKVNSVVLCPSCEKEVQLVEGKCLSCRFVVSAAPNPVFEGGYYLAMQKEDALRKAEQIKSQKEREAEIEKISQAHRDWAVRCTDMDRLAAMEDALHLLRYILLSSSDPTTIRTVVSFGKNIGDLSQVIESYITKSGATHETAYPTKNRDRPENTQEA